MRKAERATAWAVYATAAAGKDGASTSVCTQDEWDALARSKPGAHTLVRGNIASEAEAERVARDASGYVTTPRPKTR